MIDLLMILIFIVCGIQLWQGKWLWLIAGYNTANKQEKAKINGRALGKAIGGLLIFSAVLIGLMRLFPAFQPIAVVTIILLVGGMITYINLSPRFKQ